MVDELIERLCRACREGYIEREAEEVLRLNTVMQPCDQLPRLRDELAAERETVATLRAELAAEMERSETWKQSCRQAVEARDKLREALVKARGAMAPIHSKNAMTTVMRGVYMIEVKHGELSALGNALAAIDAAMKETGGEP